MTAWNTAAVLLTGLGALLFVREGVRFTLIKEIDANLREDLLEASLDIEQARSGLDGVYAELERKARGHQEHGWFIQIRGENGDLLWASKGSPLFEISTLPPVEPEAVTIEGYRLTRGLFNHHGFPVLRLRVGLSLDHMDEDLRRLTKMIGFAGLAMFLVAPISGYLLAGRAIRPLANIIHTTSDLHPSKLSERLPIRRTGDELDQLSITINGLLDRIAAYLHRKRDFIANAAHELRSPLAAIQSSVEVTLVANRSPAEYKEMLYEIHDECGALTNLVNQLLLLAESDAGTLESRRESVRLDQIVARSVDMFKGPAEQKSVDLHIAHLAPVSVLGDGPHFRQVINNLLDNAVKFTGSGGQVVVDLRIDPDERTAVLKVNDTGKGIPTQDLPYIFDRFYQADKSRDREQPARGNGLGLSICQSIVDAFHGTIQVASTPGQGTRFTVTFPCQPPSAGAHLAASHESLSAPLALSEPIHQ